MGGPGSGGRRTRYGIDECRALDVGELCDAGRWQAQPRGAVLWRARPGGEELARLSYVILPAGSSSTGLAFAYRYRQAGAGEAVLQAFELDCALGSRAYAVCPACGARVRSLYAPLGAELFACRRCYRLVYRGSTERQQLDAVVEFAGPALKQLHALPARSRRRARRRYVERPPAALARELEEQPPEGEAGERLWCLRLRAAGLSYRQIAAQLGLSKSSVARICRAGPAGIDVQALVRERLQDAYRGPALADVDDVRGARAYLRASHQHALRLGLYEHPLSEREERVVVTSGGTAEA